MTVTVKVEHIPAHLCPELVVEMSRVPCVGEYLYTEDQTFIVKAVFHPLEAKFMPIVRVTLT